MGNGVRSGRLRRASARQLANSTVEEIRSHLRGWQGWGPRPNRCSVRRARWALRSARWPIGSNQQAGASSPSRSNPSIAEQEAEHKTSAALTRPIARITRFYS
jgi:hypothetical protein